MPFEAFFLALLVVATAIIGVLWAITNKNYQETYAYKSYSVIVSITMLVLALIILI